jgi:hypothetical protein
MGIELDTGKFKIGNGIDNWSDLDYGFTSLPIGGLEGQVLAKDSDTDYDYVWVDNSAESTFFLIRNETGSTILKGTLLAAVGAETDGRIDVAPFEVTGLENSELRVVGLAAQNMPNNTNGTAISGGSLINLDTRGTVVTSIAVGDETWVAGDILYAHPTVPGKLTKVKPQHDLPVAFITVLSPSIGKLSIRVQPGNNHLEWQHDVSITTPSDNEVLTYESATSLWKNKPLPVTSVSDLDDVDLTGLDDDYILRYDAASTSWKVEVLPTGVQDLDDLTDVDLTVAPTNGQVLTYNDSTNVWEAASLPTDIVGATELDELTDVDLTVAPTDGQVLTYDNTSSQWIAASLPTDIVGATELDELTDVDLTVAPTDGQVLTYDDATSQWIAATPTGGSTVDELDDLSDVDLTTTAPVDGDVLAYDNTSGLWLPTAPTGGSGGFTRATEAYTSASLAAGAIEKGTIELGTAYRVYKVETNKPARIRLYDTVANRDADETRAVGIAAGDYSGLAMEVILTSPLTIVLPVAVDGFNNASPVSRNIPITITNADSTSGTITVTLTYIETEV